MAFFQLSLTSVLFICCSSVISFGRHKSLLRPTVMGFTHSQTPSLFSVSIILSLSVFLSHFPLPFTPLFLLITLLMTDQTRAEYCREGGGMWVNKKERKKERKTREAGYVQQV